MRARTLLPFLALLLVPLASAQLEPPTIPPAPPPVPTLTVTTLPASTTVPSSVPTTPLPSSTTPSTSPTTSTTATTTAATTTTPTTSAPPADAEDGSKPGGALHEAAGSVAPPAALPDGAPPLDVGASPSATEDAQPDVRSSPDARSPAGGARLALAMAPLALAALAGGAVLLWRRKRG